jgi:hypothetical protein
MKGQGPGNFQLIVGRNLRADWSCGNRGQGHCKSLKNGRKGQVKNSGDFYGLFEVL